MESSLYHKLIYRVLLESPAKLFLGYHEPTVPASSIRGVIRTRFCSLSNATTAEEEDLFGGPDRPGRFVVEDLRFDGDWIPDENSRSSLGKRGSGYALVPSGAMLVGTVAVREPVTERQMTLLRSAILSVEMMGFRTRRDDESGRCRIEFVEQREVGRVFISYAWEDPEHKEWVLRLADRLVRSGISVILDEYDVQLGDNLHVFMEQAVERASKVLVILTPTYKEKATRRKGGVGFEFSMITSEIFETLASNKKFLPVLRRGSHSESIPKVLLPYAYCDMSDDATYESRFSQLFSAIIGEPARKRPTPRIRGL